MIRFSFSQMDLPRTVPSKKEARTKDSGTGVFRVMKDLALKLVQDAEGGTKVAEISVERPVLWRRPSELPFQWPIPIWLRLHSLARIKPRPNHGCDRIRRRTCPAGQDQCLPWRNPGGAERNRFNCCRAEGGPCHAPPFVQSKDQSRAGEEICFGVDL